MTGKLWAYLQLVRFPDPVLVAAVTVVGSRLLRRDGLDLSTVAGIALSNTLLFAASMAINDWRDVAADALNKPWRPIPSGRISREMALGVAVFLFGAAVAVAGLVDLLFGLSALVITLLSVGYTLRLKRVPWAGNSLVAILSIYPMWCWLLRSFEVAPVFFMLAVSCFLFRLGAEILKTAEDFLGDGANGIRTIATMRGIPSANRIGSTLICAGLLLGWAPVAVGASRIAYDVGLAMSTALGAYAWMKAFFSASSGPSRSFVALERAITVLMSFAFAGLAFGWLSA